MLGENSAGSGPVIQQVRINNFKSVCSQTVTLSQLTVLVGANSSGKSSLLQALVTLAQAVREESAAPAVPLNGNMMNMGWFENVKNLSASNDETVDLGIDLAPRGGSAGESVVTGWGQFGFLGQGVVSVKYDLRFRGRSHSDPAASPIHGLSLHALLEDDRSLQIDLQHRNTARYFAAADVFAHPWFGLMPRYHASLRGKVSLGRQKATVTAAALRGCLPVSFVQMASESTVLSWHWWGALGRGPHRADPRQRPADDLNKKQLEELLVQSGFQALSEFKASGRQPGALASFLDEQVRQRSLSSPRTLSVARSQSSARLGRDLARLLPSKSRVPGVVDPEFILTIDEVSGAIYTVMARLRHLAGLRAAPLPLYPTSVAAQKGEIGPEGQFTAAVLYALKDQVVEDFDRDGVVTQRSLQSAVDRWAKELEIFSDVRPHHQGALGIDISVRQTGVDEDLDITAVGVGVSQLLPVIVRCLLSSPGDVVLLEQPELHLHPASQQRLADFLLACSLSGRQLIVETHSEHLINRLRLRAAQDQSPGRVKSQGVGLVFAERNSTTGTTTYRPVQLNEFGGFDDWPEGFFEEGIEEAKEILEAGMAKIDAFGASPGGGAA